MNSFNYYSPKTIQQAFALLNEYGRDAKVLAGGTDLLVRIKIGRATPRAVIDVKGVSELQSYIEKSEGIVRVGALTTMATIQYDSIIIQNFPAIVEAVSNIGSVQIRNRASIAGNLCNASPAADSAPSLLIYGAQIKLISPRGERILSLPEFILGPGKTALEPDELVKEVLLPLPGKDQGAAFKRLTRRKGVDLATINLCCQVRSNGLTRFALGAAGPVPFIVEDPSGKLASKDASAEEKKALIEQIMAPAKPIGDIRASKEYRMAMLVVLGQRALEAAIEQLENN